VAWLDWAEADRGLIAWIRHLLRIRRDHAVLRGDGFLTGEPGDLSLFPDVDWRDANGRIMTTEAWHESDGNTLVVTLAGPTETEDATDRVSIILHRGQQETQVTLPSPRAGYAWCLIADSATETGVEGHKRASDTMPHAGLGTGSTDSDALGAVVTGSTIMVAPRNVMALIEQPRGPRGHLAADPALLDRLAHAAGIAPQWWDVDGRRTVVSDETRRALLAAMRLPATTEGEARDSLHRLSCDRDRRALPHALVARLGEPAILCLGSEPGLGRRPIWLIIEHENGQTDRIRIGVDDGTVDDFTGVDGQRARAWRIRLPALPEGRHRLWRDDTPEAVCHLTVAPRQCFLPDSISGGARRFGISTQLYALRRANDQGIGDFTTLALLAEAAGREGAATIGINPLHMLFPGERERASPYHPSDRRFIDPIYLDVTEGIEPASIGDLVAYSEVWTLKREILERRFSEFSACAKADPAVAADFSRFLHDGGIDLWRFAAFQAIAETRPDEAWRQWPDDLRSPDSNAVKAFANEHAERVKFHQYLQFLTDQQFAATAAKVKKCGLDLGVFRDLAVGAAPDGAESWARSEELADGAWIGAPPDPFAAEGQNWHLPPPLPLRYAQSGFASFASLIAANMRHAGVLRIDHVMGLSRLFWIPDGGTGADGAYVTYPFQDLLGQVALESVRARCMVIGEDLGTVPDGLRPVLTEADVLSYRVLLLEREGRGFKPASAYPGRALACVTTHDLPPLAGWWEGADIRERVALGQLQSGPAAEQERAAERTALADALARDGCLVPPVEGDPSVAAVVEGAYKFVAGTPCDLVLVQAEDLAGMRVGVNLPGTDTERPNWRLRLPVPVETLLTDDAARTGLDAVRQGHDLSGRSTVPGGS
jgi:4-alpha-glucanotransferase